MKTILCLLPSLACTLWLCPMPLTAAKSPVLWVATDGRDDQAGTLTQPLATLSGALERISGPAPVRIIFRNGIYALTNLISFHHPMPALTIEAAPGEHPVFSGGVAIGVWNKLNYPLAGLPPIAQGKIWYADLPKAGGEFLKFRQLWVNDHKAIRARQPNDETLPRLMTWDKTIQAATIPTAALAGLLNPAHLEMIIDQVWELAILRVHSLRKTGAETLVTFEQPESQIEFTHPWPPVIMTSKYRAPFFLANAIEFLDSPGEWLADWTTGKIYYWPRNGENLTTAEVFAPLLETLLKVEGTPEHPVSHLHFKGITFKHTTWLRPENFGHVPLQAGMYLLDARKLSPKGTPYHAGLDNLGWVGRPPAAVSVQNVHQVTFERCTFAALASAGLEFADGTQDGLIEGCRFRDIGGNGIQLGHFSETNIETHLPWNPASERDICQNIRIANNLITDCGTEDWGSVGIAAGYCRRIKVEHNEVAQLPYTGISVGWGWTKKTNASRNNLIFANYVHDIGQKLGDLGAIYTLSAQPGTLIAENRLSEIKPGLLVPDADHWFYLYLDEGSTGITVRDNWCPAEKFMKNANGPTNLWKNNGPQVSSKIKNAAGLEPAFRDLPEAARENRMK